MSNLFCLCAGASKNAMIEHGSVDLSEAPSHYPDGSLQIKKTQSWANVALEPYALFSFEAVPADCDSLPRWADSWSGCG